MTKIDSLKRAMDRLNDFAENNYKDGHKPEIQAEYQALYMNYLNLYIDAVNCGLSPHIKNKSKLPPAEMKKMLEWEKRMVEAMEASIRSKGYPERNN